MNWRKEVHKNVRLFVLAGATLLASTGLNATVRTPDSWSSLENRVRHELVMLPYYSIFDDLSFRVDAGHVTLSGQVVRPTLKSDAENVVKRLEGVESVSNEIKVLPLSPFDDRIRFAVYRAIYGYGPMQRYALGSLPSIHIIVNNGNVTLSGVVANQMDRNIANIRANGVPGVFSVQNNLQIEQRG